MCAEISHTFRQLAYTWFLCESPGQVGEIYVVLFKGGKSLKNPVLKLSPLHKPALEAMVNISSIKQERSAGM